MTLLAERPQMSDFLHARGLVGEPESATVRPLSGGVSSDIWLVCDSASQLVVKQPLGDLKVATEWKAPLGRSASEANWLATVTELVPGACPRVLAFDSKASMLALEYLDPSTHRLWKADLLSGTVDLGFAGSVGDTLGLIHECTAGRADLAELFDTDDLFDALRFDPYFRRLVVSHPDLATPVEQAIRTTMAHKKVLVHGDVSPKNILVGPDGPVFLDAETAWWGDPAFDVAFCLNHLLLKQLLVGHGQPDPVSAGEELLDRYVPHVDWEATSDLLGRVLALVPFLLLARVDGRSPVEYLSATEQELVRSFAIPRIVSPPERLRDLFTDWRALSS